MAQFTLSHTIRVRLQEEGYTGVYFPIYRRCASWRRNTLGKCNCRSKGIPVFADEGIINEMMGDAGIAFVNGSADWNSARKNPVATGVALLGQALHGGL